MPRLLRSAYVILDRLLPRNEWMLMPYFELFMSYPKDELHQWNIGSTYPDLY